MQISRMGLFLILLYSLKKYLQKKQAIITLGGSTVLETIIHGEKVIPIALATSVREALTNPVAPVVIIPNGSISARPTVVGKETHF